MLEEKKQQLLALFIQVYIMIVGFLTSKFVSSFVSQCNLLGQHPVEQSVCLLLLLGQLVGAFLHQSLQVVRVLLHDGQHVVKYVRLSANISVRC